MKRYEVFISSTYKDLKSERRIVSKALLEMGCFPSGMELFPATDQRQFEFIKKVIDRADYYILILGGHIGSVLTGNKSITRMEYEYAVEKGIPVIVFVKADKDGDPLECESKKTKKKAYGSFLKKVGKPRLYKSFQRKEELSGMVKAAIAEEIEEHPRSGWRRDYHFISKCDKNPLLKGNLLYSFCIGHEIYDKESEMEEIHVVDDLIKGCELRYGIGSQGTFRLDFGTERAAISLYNETPDEFIQDEDGFELKNDVILQVSLAMLGNIEEVLLFYSVGDTINMATSVFRIEGTAIQRIGKVLGQEFMWLDYSLRVPFGGQGMYDTFVLCEGTIMRAEESEL